MFLSKSSIFKIFRISIFCFLVSLALPCSAAQWPESLLSVSGTGHVNVMATIAEVRVGIEVSDQTAEETQEKLAKRQQRLFIVLKEQKAEKVETASLSLLPRYDKDDSTKIIGYVGRAVITFSASAEQAGPLLDVALASGANQNLGISLRPSDEQLKDARAETLKMASSEALAEGQLVLDRLGLVYKKIARVEVAPKMGIRPVGMSKMALKTASQTQVTEQQVQVYATISLELEYE